MERAGLLMLAGCPFMYWNPPLSEKPSDQLNEPLGVLDLGAMAAVVDDFQADTGLPFLKLQI